jgi:hypothetical protein
MSLVILGTEVKDIPIKPGEIEFDKDGKSFVYLTKEGKKLKKTQVQKAEYVWTDEDGNEFDGKPYKSFKGKPVSEFKKSNLIDKYDVISRSELQYFIQNEHTYLLSGKDFKAKFLKEVGADNGMTFKFVIRGFKVYKAVITHEENLGGKLLMRLYRGDLRKADLNEETKEVKAVDEDVDSLDLDAMDV